MLPQHVLPPQIKELYSAYEESKLGKLLATERYVNQKKLYTHKELVEDLEPYTLLPKSEISKIIKLAFQLILINMTVGRKVQLNMFGEFSRLYRVPSPFFEKMTNKFLWFPARYTAKFTPYPYAKWLMSPHAFSTGQKYKMSMYYIHLQKLKEQLWNHHDKYPIDDIAPDMSDPLVIERYNYFNTKKLRSFSSLK